MFIEIDRARGESCPGVASRGNSVMSFGLGLMESSSSRQRRYSIDDSDRMGSSQRQIIYSNEQVDEFESIQDRNELLRIVRQQQKYIQQLQLHARVAGPDIIQSPSSDRLAEQNKVTAQRGTPKNLFHCIRSFQNLNLVMNTYKNDSDMLKNEVKRLQKTVELNRTTLQQYENVIKEQQDYIERIKSKFDQYENVIQVRRFLSVGLQNEKTFTVQNQGYHPSMSIEPRGPGAETSNDLIINLDIDVIPASDLRKRRSFHLLIPAVRRSLSLSPVDSSRQTEKERINDD